MSGLDDYDIWDWQGLTRRAFMAHHAENQTLKECEEYARALPTGAAERKAIPVARGFLDYFPDAICAVAELSRIGNEQHNPGEPLHWAKEKSTDEADALLRHLIERGTIDTDGVRHSTKVAWRAMALLQRELDEEKQSHE